MFRGYMLGLDVLEELVNVEVLLAGFRVVADTKNHHVKLVEIFGILSLIKE